MAKRESEEQEERPRKKKKRKGDRSTKGSGKSEQGTPEFVPSTKEELKSYARNAKKRARIKKKEKKNRGADKKEPRNEKARAFLEELKATIPKESIDKKRFIARYVKLINEKKDDYDKDKNKDKRWAPSIPKFDPNDSKYAEVNFVYDIQTTLAQFSWKDLNRLIAGGLGKKVKTETFTKAFHTVEYMMYRVLGIVTEEGSVKFKLRDRDATLKLWPVKVKERSDSMAKSSKKEKSKKSSEEVTEKKKKKKSKESEPSEEKPAKKRKKVELSDTTIIKKGKSRSKGGPKSKIVALVPKSGITLKKLLAAAEDIRDAKTVKKWITMMAKNGFLITE